MPIRLILVDDHRLVREGLRRILEQADDIELVGEGASGQDALDLVESTAPDVLLLDISLPECDGFDVLETLTRRRSTTRVLMLSMHSDPEYARAAVDHGAAGLLGKDGSPDQLLEGIRRAAAGESLPVGRTLTARERQVLAMVAEGLSNEDIASCLGLSPKTVDGHLERIMQTTRIHTRAGLVVHGRRLDPFE